MVSAEPQVPVAERVADCTLPPAIQTASASPLGDTVRLGSCGWSASSLSWIGVDQVPPSRNVAVLRWRAISSPPFQDFIGSVGLRMLSTHSAVTVPSASASSWWT